ncbi:MAG: hypothetical protein RR101_12380 [Burkholderiaceae bacterium]
MIRRGLLAIAMALFSIGALALEPLADGDLAAVSAQDGFRFDFKNFELSGNARITYTAPPPSSASVWWSHLFASRSDDPLREFTDPYKLDIVARPGLADAFILAFPANPDGAARWRIALDWGVNADGISQDGGSVLMRDWVVQGGGAQWSTPTDRDGTAWGLGVRAQIADLLFQPRGRTAASWDSPGAAPEQLWVSGIRIGAATADGSAPTAPWQIADVTRQPGIFNVEPGADGNPRLHVGIGWPTGPEGAPTGMISVDRVMFQSDVSGNLDLGSSRIRGIQIQFMDVKFRP